LSFLAARPHTSLRPFSLCSNRVCVFPPLCFLVLTDRGSICRWFQDLWHSDRKRPILPVLFAVNSHPFVLSPLPSVFDLFSENPPFQATSSAPPGLWCKSSVADVCVWCHSFFALSFPGPSPHCCFPAPKRLRTLLRSHFFRVTEIPFRSCFLSAWSSLSKNCLPL